MVYIDNYNAPFGKMTMCHMMADSTAELLDMCRKIGVSDKWIQKPGTGHEHFDICLSKKALAIKYGAIEVGYIELGRMYRNRNDGNTPLLPPRNILTTQQSLF